MTRYRIIVLVIGGLAAALLILGWALPEPGRYDGDVDDEVACTLVGCSSIWGVERSAIMEALPAARSVTVCANDECRTFGRGFQQWRQVGNGKAAGVVDLRGVELGGTATVKIVVRDARRKIIKMSQLEGDVEPHWPNGEACPPPCFSVRAEIDPATGELRRT